MTNLLSNAIKFTTSGQIRFKARVESKSESTYSFRCSVEDTGIGIDPTKLEGLFDDFTQADASTTRQYGGTGLGLSICKKLCELMGGHIEATSEIGKGSCFSFEIELGKAKARVRACVEENPYTEGNDELAFGDSRILLVEDNKVNQLVAQHMLTQIGLEFDICENGVEAIEALKRGIYSLVLMDCQMPEMDGYEATERIRKGDAGERCQGIAVIAMTANAMQGDKEKCLAAGMNDYIAKPINQDLIRQVLVKWLQDTSQ